MVSAYRQLVRTDRIEIERLMAGGAVSDVARRLGVHESIVSREVHRRSFCAERVHANVSPNLRRRLNTKRWSQAVYVAESGQWHAAVAKARSQVP